MEQIFVINTVQATAADLTTPGAGKVLVTGDKQGFIRDNVGSIKVLPQKTETAKVYRVTAAAAPAADTEYSFWISQEVDGERVRRPVHYKTGAVAPNATAFGVALDAAIDAVLLEAPFGITSAAHATGNGGADLTGAAGNPLFTVEQPNENMVVAETPFTETTGTTAASHSSGVLTITVSDSTDYPVGSTINYSDWSGTAVINGNAAAAGVDLRVASQASGTTITAFITLTSGSFSSGAQEIILYAQEASGTATVLAERNITGGGDPNVDIVSTNVYHEVVVSGGSVAGKSKEQVDLAPYTKRYFISDTGSPTKANALLVRFVQVDGRLDASGDLDPLLFT